MHITIVGLQKYLEDYYGAIFDYTKAIEINPKDLAYNNRGYQST